MGAHRVIAVDHFPHRLDLAKSMGAEVINFEEVDVREALVEMTGGIGPDACIDAVGMESHGVTADSVTALIAQICDRSSHAVPMRHTNISTAGAGTGPRELGMHLWD